MRSARCIERLEEEFGARVGARFALAVSSGTMALEIALRACGVEPGDEVILSPYDWGAAAGAVLRLGAIPVFADIDPSRYTLDPACVGSRIGARTAAIVVTHLFGQPADMAAIVRVARKAEVFVIEDCAQAFGASIGGRSVGTFGDAGCFSLGRGKLVSGGEGGVLVLQDSGLYEEAFQWSQHPARQLNALGRVGPGGDLNLNGRLNPFAAALALQSLSRSAHRLNLRRQRCGELGRAMAELTDFAPPAVFEGASHAWHRFCPSLVSGPIRAEVVALLTIEGLPVGEDPIGRPLHLAPVFQERSYGAPGWPWNHAGSNRRYRAGDCPVAEDRCARTGLVVGVDWARAGEEEVERARELRRLSETLEAYRF
jgi:dTDP-4-amino-4,6-dideoxygalactose transaminase